LRVQTFAADQARRLWPRLSRKAALRAVVLFALAGAAATGAAVWYLRSTGVPVASLVLYGNVDIREVQAAFNDNGPITRMLVQEGDPVHEGELIAEIDNARYLAARDEAAHQVQNQQEILTKLLNGSRPEEIAQAKAAMQSLEATYRDAQLNFARVSALARQGIDSQQQLDSARAQNDSLEMSFEAARQVYLLAAKGPRVEDIDAARAALKAAQAALALAQQQLLDTNLYAPADGVVEDRILEPGDMASPNTPVYTIALTNPLWVRAYVPETDLGKVALGMAAAVTTDSFPGRIYCGWVGYLSPTAEFTPKTVETPQLRTRLVYQVRIYVRNTRNELRLGMPATVTIDLSHGRDGKAGPSACKAEDAATR
jgi:HlyD family secretion protein